MMSTLKKLKLSDAKRTAVAEAPEQIARTRMTDALNEQLALVEADIAGRPHNPTKLGYVTNEQGQRVKTEMPKRIRKWYWHDIAGTWYLALRYGNKPVEIAAGKSVIEVPSRAALPDAIKTIVTAVQAGELDKQLLAVRKQRFGKKA
jgi:hypothetical protein